MTSCCTCGLIITLTSLLGGEQLISASDHDETADLEVGRLDDRLFNYEMQIFRAEPTHTLVSL